MDEPVLRLLSPIRCGRGLIESCDEARADGFLIENDTNTMRRFRIPHDLRSSGM